MTIQEAQRYIKNELLAIYEEGEASAISDWVTESVSGVKKTERSARGTRPLTEEQERLVKEYTVRLLTHEPVQYVLNESWFCGLKFYVDRNVLIPRPETEELVEWVITNCKFPLNTLSVFDIGSGSGCIPLSLKRKLRKANIWSCDVSAQALQVAKRNASALNVDVNFILMDFLKEEERRLMPRFDIIISNPPYVPEKDKESMQPNVLAYEPYTALFVPDDDALLFYRAIADFGKEHLNPGGLIYVEMHEDLSQATNALFQSYGYKTEIRRDMQGKERMLKAGTD